MLGVAHAQIIQEGVIFSGQPKPTWVHVASNYITGCTTTTCTVTGLTATTAGSVLIAGMVDLTAGVHNILSASGGGGTWIPCPASGCVVTKSPQFTLDMAYNITGTGGATSVTLTINSASTNWSAFVDEFKCTANCGSGRALDAPTSGTVTSAGCTACVGAGFTGLTGPSDLIIEQYDQSQTVLSVTAPYVREQMAGSGPDWVAYELGASTGAAPTINFSVSSVFAGTGLAFK